MELLKDEALVLKKKNVNEANVSLIIFSKKIGKVNAIVYGARSSNKKEKISLSPSSYIDVELTKKLDNIVLNNYVLTKKYNSLYKNIKKLELMYYIMDVLNKILEYEQKEEELYEVIKTILKFLDEVDEKLLNKEYIIKFLIRFLRRIMIYLGIYEDENINFDMFTLLSLEENINKYFDINIDHSRIIIGGMKDEKSS